MHSAMNASFIAAGILTVAGAIWLRGFWPRSRGTTVALILWGITGLGKIGVGLVPENTNISLHLLAAFNVPVGCVAILLLSLPRRQSSRALSFTGIGWRSWAWSPRRCPPRPSSPAPHPSTSG
jgi:hypothetical membrane protein